MNKVCTSRHQSLKLIELGINIKTADMDYIPFANNPQEYDCVINVWNNEHEKDWIPAWSLSALLGLMPKIYEYKTDAGCQPLLCKGWDNSKWHVVYRSSIHITEWYNDPLDAAFEMICWLLENKKL